MDPVGDAEGRGLRPGGIDIADELFHSELTPFHMDHTCLPGFLAGTGKVTTDPLSEGTETVPSDATGTLSENLMALLAMQRAADRWTLSP